MNMPNESPFSPTPPMSPAPSEPKSNVPPPPPEITIRTMQSDEKSISETGGGAPMGQSFSAPAVRPEEKLTIPGYTGPEEAIFTPENIPAQPGQGITPGTTAEKATSKSIKTIVVTLGSIVLVSGLGFLGYYFVYPLIVTAPPAPTPPPLPPPVVQTPPPAPTPAPAAIHKSYFTKAADKVERIPATASTLTAVSLRTGATAAAAEKLASGSLKEIYFADEKDETAGFVNFMKAAIPEFAGLETQLGQLFEDDFTGFLYYDGTNVWPGYIAKLKSGANDILAKTTISEIEKYSESLKNLFLSDPGAAAAVYKDGQVNGHAGRYIPYTQKDASVNIVWLDNYLLITTNYKAAIEAATRLGYPKQ